MRRHIPWMTVVAVAGLLLAWPIPAFAETPLSQALVTGPTQEASSTTLPPLTPSASTPSTLSLFRDPPTVTGRYELGDGKVLPFIGLGFRGGETTDINRRILRGSQGDSLGLSSRGLGQAPLPNEFQAGVRIPF